MTRTHNESIALFISGNVDEAWEVAQYDGRCDTFSMNLWAKRIQDRYEREYAENEYWFDVGASDAVEGRNSQLEFYRKRNMEKRYE